MGIPQAVLDRAEKAEKLQKEAEKQAQGTPEPTKVADTPDYKHKYEVLQGKFNAQAKDLNAQVEIKSAPNQGTSIELSMPSNT